MKNEVRRQILEEAAERAPDLDGRVMYPWHLWADGKWHTLVQGRDYLCTTNSFLDLCVKKEQSTGALIQTVVRRHRGYEIVRLRVTAGNAEELRRLVTPQKPGPKSPYLWDIWLDGKAHLLIPGQDFSCSRAAMRSQLHKNATMRGVRVEVHNLELGLHVKARR